MDIPPPIRDAVRGQVIRPKDSSCLLLVLGDTNPVCVAGKVIAQGSICLSYAFALYSNDDALLPQFVLDDFRRSYTGLEAIKFLRQKGDTYPRADVIGVGARTGKRREHYLKEVDLGSPMKVVVYSDKDLEQFIGFLDIALKLDAAQQPGTWTDLAEEINIPLLMRIVPCVRVHPDSVIEIVGQLLST